MNLPLNKYLAKIVYRIVGDTQNTQEQFDEQLCLIEARDAHEAFFKARMLGVKNEEEVDHESGRGIFWKFVDVPYLKMLDTLEDGTELYSCISERDIDDHYEGYVKKRAHEIHEQVQVQQVLMGA